VPALGRHPLPPDDADCESLVSDGCRSQGSVVHRAAIRLSTLHVDSGLDTSNSSRAAHSDAEWRSDLDSAVSEPARADV